MIPLSSCLLKLVYDAPDAKLQTMRTLSKARRTIRQQGQSLPGHTMPRNHRKQSPPPCGYRACTTFLRKTCSPHKKGSYSNTSSQTATPSLQGKPVKKMGAKGVKTTTVQVKARQQSTTHRRTHDAEAALDDVDEPSRVMVVYRTLPLGRWGSHGALTAV